MCHAIITLQADLLFEYDADGSHHPKYLLPMLQRLQKNADVVLGSRYVPGGSLPSNWNWYRKSLSVLGNRIAQWVLSPRYQDYTSGFRASKVAFIKPINLKNFISKNYAYKIQLLWEQHQLGARIEEHPIDFLDRQKGHSKLPHNSIIDTLRVLFILRLRLHQKYIKTCLVGLLGFIFQFFIYNTLRFMLPPSPSAIIAFEAACALNFINNNRFTFKTQRYPLRNNKQWLLKLFYFNSLSLGSLLLQLAFLSYYHHFWLPSSIK